MIGLEFTFTDGSKEHFDPIDEQDITETETEINFTRQDGHKESFSKIEWTLRKYILCPTCGYEVYEDGCTNYNCL